MCVPTGWSRCAARFTPARGAAPHRRPLLAVLIVAAAAVGLGLQACGGSGATATAATPELAVPAIQTQPISAGVNVGGSASFSVVASGTGLAYQWRLGGVAIAGATAATYAVTNASATQAGDYDVVVSNSAGSVTSAAATLAVTPVAVSAPVITAQPTAATVTAGGAATFSVSASGVGSYAWRKGGEVIAGATAASYTIAAVALSDAGSYDVVLTNATGTTTSQAVTLTVNATAAGGNTAEVVRAADAFAATLDTTQRSTLQMAWSLATARRWSNLPAAMVARNGLAFSAMTPVQAAAALALAEAALGPTGRKLLDDIRTADNYLVSQGASTAQYGDGGYYVAFVGAPSTSALWTLQIGGHHLAYNITYNAGVRSTTPVFLGVEPTGAFTFSGTSFNPMAAQNTAAGELLAALAAYGTALLPGRYDDVLFAANGTGRIDGTLPKAYPSGSTGRGVAYSALTAADQARVRAMINAWVSTQHPEAAGELLANYLDASALAQTYAAYATATSIDTVGAYLRIDGPRVWIEYSAQRGIILAPAHPHTVWRDKSADYGARF